MRTAITSIRIRWFASGESFRHPQRCCCRSAYHFSGQRSKNISENPRSISEAERIFRGILAGLAHAHNLGVVHRDLKPSNVLLDNSGTLPIPRITDFGIAKVMDSGKNLTRTSASMGTPRYMAPEQWRDSKSVDPRADIFSMGSMLYELICHQSAFPADNIPDIYSAVASERYIDPREHCLDCPEHIYTAIVGCLRADRSASSHAADNGARSPAARPVASIESSVWQEAANRKPTTLHERIPTPEPIE